MGEFINVYTALKLDFNHIQKWLMSFVHIIHISSCQNVVTYHP